MVVLQDVMGLVV